MTPEQREILDGARALLAKLDLDVLEQDASTYRELYGSASVEWPDFDALIGSARALQSLLGRISELEGHVATLEAQQRTDRTTIANQADTIARLKRAMVECKACDGTGKIERDARADDCDACGGLGVWSL